VPLIGQSTGVETLPATVLAEMPAVPESVGPLRRRATAFAERAGAPRRRVSDIALAVSEACSNVVIHAYRDRPGMLALRAEACQGEIRMKVVDEGDGLTPRPDSPGLGLGLPLIARLTDRFEVNPGPAGRGTELSMAFRV
jgi:serine/threonine-protein kinase RsbW/stage II sporulation protein AB (anti-sigma F factor)